MESRMTKGLLDYIVSIKGALVAPFSAKGDLVTLGGKAKNATKNDLTTTLVNDVKGVMNVKNQMTIEESK